MTLNEERVAFFHTLGLALAEWTNVERGLFHVLAVCFKPDDQQVLGVGFVGMEGFRTKLQFADRAIKRRISGSRFSEQWAKLYDNLEGHGGTRNKLAHFRHKEYPSNNPGQRIAIAPWITAKGLNPNKPPPGSLCVRNIARARLEFFAISRALSNFSARLTQRPEPFPKSDELIVGPPTIQQLNNQIHEALGHQQKSSREKRRDQDIRNAAASLNERGGS